MNLAVRLYSDTTNPKGIPSDWVYEVRELGTSTNLPKTGTWQLMTIDEYNTYVATRKSSYDSWEIDYSLAGLIEEKIVEIDKKTQEIIDKGFSYNGKVFSLSSNAQLNWLGLKLGDAENLVLFPVSITTKFDEEYKIIDKDEMKVFYGMGLGYVKSIVDAGRDLKISAKAATSIEELNNIKDNR